MAMSSPPRQQRARRSNSVFAYSASTILNTIKTKIKYIDDKSNRGGTGCIITEEETYVKTKLRKFRRCYLKDNNYKVGWVVDADVNRCMICLAGFGWVNLKHHCRACGLLLCYTCTPYTTQVNHLNEEGGSRVCINCFGLRVADPASPTTQSSNGSRSHHNYDHLDTANRPSIGNRMVVSRTELSLDTMDTEADDVERERAMIPLYEEAYNTMRQFIPLDIHRITYEQLLDYGLAEPIADRIWSNKILWLIVMHPDDIAKLHLAELRTKYLAENLDVTELRAVWYNVPGWDVDPSDGSSKVLQNGKNKWRAGIKARLNMLTELMAAGKLGADQHRNKVYRGHEDEYLFDPEMSLLPESDPYQPQVPQYAPNGSGRESLTYQQQLSTLLTPAENVYGSRYSNTSASHDLIGEVMRGGGGGGPVPRGRQRTISGGGRLSLTNPGGGAGGGRQQILLSDEDQTEYPPMGALDASAISAYSEASDPRFDVNLSLASSPERRRVSSGGNDYFQGDLSFQDDSSTVAEEAAQQAHLNQASRALNESTNRVLSQFYLQQFEEQQMKIRLAQEAKERERLERQQQQTHTPSSSKKKFTNTGSRSRSTSKQNSPAPAPLN